MSTWHCINISVRLACRSSRISQRYGVVEVLCRMVWQCRGRTQDTPKYLDQFLTVFLGAFTIGLVFAKQSKQGFQPYVSTTPTVNYLTTMSAVASKTIKIFRSMCSCSQYIALLPLVSIVLQKSPVVKVASKTFKNWSGCLGVCVVAVNT